VFLSRSQRNYIEDDPETAAYIANGLREHGHVPDHAANRRDGLFLAAGAHYDLMIVDRMLPGLDGLAIVKTIRAPASTRRCCSSPRWAASTIALPAWRPAATTISSNLSHSRSCSHASMPWRAGRRLGAVETVCFGGKTRNRLFMAASQSVYALYVETQGVLGG
jgi:response regulator receiver domain-containing protein